MLPFSGITLQQNILKIGELLHDLWWMDKRPYIAPCNPCLKKFTFLRRNRVDILEEINVQVGKNLPCHRPTASRILSYSLVMELAALELRSKYSLSEQKPA
jgi:hypothetical protein